MSRRIACGLVQLLTVLILLGPATQRLWAQPTGPQRVSVSVEFSQRGYVPGDQGALAVILDIEEHWHVQPGVGSPEEPERYIPTSIDLTLPQGWTRLKTQWPKAHEVIFGPPGAQETIFAYEGRAIAYIPFRIGSDGTPGEVAIPVRVGYQACDDAVCEMPVTLESTAATRIFALEEAANIPEMKPIQIKVFDDFDAVAAYVGGPSTDPVKSEPDNASATESKKEISGEDVRMWTIASIVVIAMLWMIMRTFAATTRASWRLSVLIIGVVAGGGWIMITRGLTSESEVHWQPYSPDVLAEAQAQNKTVVLEFTADWCGNCIVLERTVLSKKNVVAALNEPDVQPIRVDLTGQNQQGWAQLAELGSGGIPFTAVYRPGIDDPVKFRSFYTANSLLAAIRGEANNGEVFDFFGLTIGQEGISIWLILVLALVGGFLMNFTPCVLPVIPIKILSLQAHAKHPAKCFMLGLVFGLGIIAAFAILGILIAGLRGTAAGLDWGEMFKFWWVNLLLGAFVGAMGLGMLGLFTIKLPQFVYMFNPQSDTTMGSFAMGIFTAILSTPCTGPLVGAMVAWAVAGERSPMMGLFTFVVMGVGMAFPYVLLTARPKWLERLPRTGPGSELVKQVLGVLLIAVAVWFIGIAAETISAAASL